MERNSSICEIKGIGAKMEQLFHRIGVYTVGDILLHFPRDYEKMPPIESVSGLLGRGAQAGETAAVAGRVEQAPSVRRTGKNQITTLTLRDGAHSLKLVWFHMPYLRSALKVGSHFIFLGKIAQAGGALSLEQPQTLTAEKYGQMQGCLWPCYALTQGLSRNMISKAVRQALEALNLPGDYLPEGIRQRHELMGQRLAMEAIHFPESEGALRQARKRLIFDEFFQFILAAKLQKSQIEQVTNEFSFVEMGHSIADTVAGRLPYELTAAQRRVLAEVRENMRSPVIMQRLIQGDVGSGKTILAFLAMLDCAESGYQSALMAPTEVLAQQHYETFVGLCEQHHLSIPVILLTGSMGAGEKRRAYDRIQLYPKAMVIGTHALIQERTLFDNLALVITDEQHRFGVKQREKLYRKGAQPHILVMSATPIPRTLALILYGDLDISVLDEAPAKRLPIKNCVVNKSYRPKAYEFIRNQARLGHQAYVICPLVEESEGLEAENVEGYARELARQLPELSIGCLHGKMKGTLKNQIMEEFAAGRIQALVSTTVIEVGVNVPNATVMLIEDAQRFGLAQLHQLRGRVGRGDDQSYCIMVNTAENEKSKKRLDILNRSSDGFYIASEDLKLRGPGDFFGIRQSGLLQFRLGDIYQDSEILQAASEEANKILAEDPELGSEEYQGLRRQMEEYLREFAETVNL